MSNSNSLTSNVLNNNINNPTRPKACRNVRTHMHGVSFAFETGKTKTKRSEDVNIAVKKNKFDAWKADAKKFSWDLFAIPQDLVDSFRSDMPKRTAPSAFHRYASGVVKNNGWKYIHAMTLWSLLPDDYKSEWKAAAELGSVQGTRKSTPPCADVPNFKELDHFHDEKCVYFIFQAAPDLSASPAGDAFPTSQHSTFDNPNGAILLKDDTILTEDDNSRPIPNLFDDLLDFDNSLTPIGQPIPPELNLQNSSLTYIPTFEFGLISDFGVDNLIPSRDSIPPSEENLTPTPDEQHPAKRRRRNSTESTGYRDYLPTQNPKLRAPAGAVTSASLPSYASTSTGIRGQECRDQYDIGASIFWGCSDIAPSNFTSVLGSGQSNGENALDSGTIADLLSTLTRQPTAEYLADSLLETQESSNYEFPGGFGF